MPAVVALLKGQAVADLLADFNTGANGTPDAISLRQKIMGSNGLNNDVSFAGRPNTSTFSGDCFIFPANPGSSTWPSFKDTAIPFPNGANNTEFGSWNSGKTAFTVNKAGLYTVSGSINIGTISGSNWAYGTNLVGRIMLDISGGSSAARYTCGNYQTQGSTQIFTGGMISWNMTLSLEANQVIQIMGSRSKYCSSYSDDMLGNDLGGYGGVSNWVTIARLR